MFNQIQSYLIDTIFTAYIYILLVRFILQCLGASSHNPVSRLLITLTDPLIKPLRKVLPNIKNIDYGLLFLAWFFSLIKLWLLAWITESLVLPMLMLLFLGVAHVLTATVNVFFWSILLVAILSWLHISNSPVVEVLYRLTEPLLKHARRIIPPIAGFDLSPIPVLIALRVIEMLLLSVLTQLAYLM